MKGRNCPNCGAPLDNEKIKCPYCGTLYYDLSTIPMNQPFFLSLNVGSEECPKIITSRAICNSVSIQTSVDCFPEAELQFILLS